MDNKTIIVSAGIIQKEELTLIAQRKQTSEIEPNKWEFPGGKIEFQETPEECLIREIKEELNININITSLYTVKSHIYNKNQTKTQVILIVFVAKYLSGDIQTIDCQDYAWITKEDLKKYEFVQADQSIAHKYFNMNN